MPSQTHVRPLPPGVRARLDKLMLMLGSVNDNERASAAGLITVLLKDHGLDWHDVVGSIGTPAPPPHAIPVPPKPKYSESNLRVMSAAELKPLVHRILRSPINNRARQFLAGMVDRAQIYGSVSFSQKQWHWLQDLAQRAGAI